MIYSEVDLRLNAWYRLEVICTSISFVIYELNFIVYKYILSLGSNLYRLYDNLDDDLCFVYSER